MKPSSRRLSVALCIALVSLPVRAFAVLDIDDKGPVIDVGAFRMRVTNAGIVGNAFFSEGRSFDPSLEYPAYSGHEMLNYASLWVGARNASGVIRVSGDPLLEWRPTLDPKDRVVEARRGRLGSLWLVDDDGDGAIDEETPNGRDDDHDGEIDEDIGLTADQLLAADYTDDQPEAVRFGNGTENHIPLGLSVHQEVLAWGRPGYDRWAALNYTITNHGTTPLEDVYVGLYADLDSRRREDASGHINDRIGPATWSFQVNDGLGINTITWEGPRRDPIKCGPGPGAPPPEPCIRDVVGHALVLGDVSAAAPARIAVMGLDHSTDPLGLIPPAARYARAPAQISFQNMVFSNDRPPGQGGVPTTDLARYAALKGQLAQAPDAERGADYVALISCGPFARLDPGQSITFSAALIVAPTADSVEAVGRDALRHHDGVLADLLPDIATADSTVWYSGESGLNGHESCIAAPPGVTFEWDPHCYNGTKFPGCEFQGPPVTYTADSCIWTDADCDPCTGFGGRESHLYWSDPGAIPPAPGWRVTPGDHRVTIEWDNRPEVLLAGSQYGSRESGFLGYRIYRIDDWSHRGALLPERRQWSIRRAFSDDSLDGATPLAAVTDSTVDYERVLFERKLYPPGRYRFVDTTPLNGFDYVYVVTSLYDYVSRQPDGSLLHTPLESALLASFDARVTPRAEAVASDRGVWVVPNPFRGTAAWERPPVSGDIRTRHIDFMGMPKEVATLKIWTVAGDLVQVIHHDGRAGAGEAAWDLVSRNGQEVESGIYLFTVESPFGLQRGRFVVIR